MKVPQGLGNLKTIKAREKKAFAESAKWEDQLDDAYEFTLPQRNLFNREDKGQKKMDRIFDSTAQDSIKKGASKVQANTAPIWTNWATFEPSPEVLRQIEGNDEFSEIDIRKNLETQAEIVFDVINRSNFGTQFYEFILDWLIGTGTLMVEEETDDEMPIVFSSVPQIGVAFEEGPRGTVENHYFKLKVKARNIERKWPGFEVSATLAKVIEKAPDDDIKISQAILFNIKTKQHHAVVWVDNEDKVSWVQDYDDGSPMVTARYAKTSGEIRGRGPVLDVLPDIKSLNKAKEFGLTKAAIDLSGIWTATDDGITNPYNIVIAPGVVIPVQSNQSNNPSLARLDTGSDLSLPMFIIEDLQTAIKRALFNEHRELSDSIPSATQFIFEAREFAENLGSAGGRLQTEALIPILKQVHAILKRRGMVQPLIIGGREIAIKFTSPLARTQDAEDLSAVQQAVEFTIQTAGPDQAKMAFKLEDIGTWAAEKTGMPQELVRTKGEKDKVIQAGANAVKEGILPVQPQQAAQ